MTEFEDIVFSKNSIPSLIMTVIMMIVIPVAFFVFWRRKYKQKTNISYLFAGAVGFLISARVLELGTHYFCIIDDNTVSRFINGNKIAYVLYGTIMAGVFEECGRHIVLKHVMKKNRSRENGILYGIGHGGIEVLAVLLPTMITYLIVAVLFSQGDLEKALASLKITESTASAALPAVKTAAAFDYTMMAMNVIERILAMFLHIGFTVIVFYGVINAKIICLPAAILLHMLADTFPALYQRDLVPLWSVEVWAAICTAAVVYIAYKLYSKQESANFIDDPG